MTNERSPHRGYLSKNIICVLSTEIINENEILITWGDGLPR